jgi:hypothetical protein
MYSRSTMHLLLKSGFLYNDLVYLNRPVTRELDQQTVVERRERERERTQESNEGREAEPWRRGLDIKA